MFTGGVIMRATHVVALCLVWGVVPLVCPTPSDPQIPKTYNVSLDDPPESRWDHVLKDYVQDVPNLIATIR